MQLDVVNEAGNSALDFAMISDNPAAFYALTKAGARKINMSYWHRTAQNVHFTPISIPILIALLEHFQNH